MSISRRKFIKIGVAPAALLAAGGLGLSGIASAQTRQNSFDRNLSPAVYDDLLMRYHAEDFRKLINSQFSLFAENFAATAVLSEVEEKKSRVKSGRRNRIDSSENFVLTFRASTSDIEQATYTVIHGDLGQFDLLLVPEKNAKGEMLLTAVINRL